MALILAESSAFSVTLHAQCNLAESKLSKTYLCGSLRSFVDIVLFPTAIVFRLAIIDPTAYSIRSASAGQKAG
jgi:glutathione S-transferase